MKLVFWVKSTKDGSFGGMFKTATGGGLLLGKGSS